MKYLLILVFLLGFLVSQGQNILVEEEPGITAMFQKYLTENKSSNTVKGWRIQITTTDDRRRMERTKNKFGRLYPGYKVKWKHESPYYKVMIGAWESQLHLKAFLLELKDEFPNAIPVPDDIKKSELLDN